MSKIEQLIKSRKEEALTKKISQKVRSIVKFMGKKIIHQGDLAYEEWSLLHEDIFEASETSRQIGWLFQGYVWGKDFEIQYLMETEILTTTWFGDTVYKEVEGVAIAFVPGEWEDFLAKMYNIALPKEEKYASLQDKEKKEEQTNLFQKMENYLLKTWGISF